MHVRRFHARLHGIPPSSEPNCDHWFTKTAPTPLPDRSCTCRSCTCRSCACRLQAMHIPSRLDPHLPKNPGCRLQFTHGKGPIAAVCPAATGCLGPAPGLGWHRDEGGLPPPLVQLLVAADCQLALQCLEVAMVQTKIHWVWDASPGWSGTLPLETLPTMPSAPQSTLPASPGAALSPGIPLLTQT